jgi:hypothetical protein
MSVSLRDRNILHLILINLPTTQGKIDTSAIAAAASELDDIGRKHRGIDPHRS